MDSTVKQILNSLKCPVCGGQVDLFDHQEGKRLSHPMKFFNYCCVKDWEHYRINFYHLDPTDLKIEYETVVVYEGKRKYEVNQYYDLHTEFWVFEVDPEHRLVEEKTIGQIFPPSSFKFDKWLFDFSQTNHQKIVNKLKTILVFQ